ncbi:MAG: methyl-accepting chemotaxis protein [Pseudomonas sp.]
MFRQISIAMRAALGFALIAAVVILLGVFAVFRLNGINNAAEEAATYWTPGLVTAGDVEANFLRVRALTLRLMLNRSADGLRGGLASVESVSRELSQRVSDLEAHAAAKAESKEAFRRFKEALGLYQQAHAKVMEFARQGLVDEAVSVVNSDLNGHANAATSALIELADFYEKGAETVAIEAGGMVASALRGVIIAMVLAALLTVVLALVLTRSITRPLNQAVSVAEVIASGDLTREVPVEGNDELSKLQHSLSQMQASLRETIQRIADSSNQLASASEELHAVTEDSTRGLHQQNTEIEQAATAVNEMTAAVEEVARNAVSTSEASRESNVTALQGREQVRQTVDSIGQLADDVTTTSGEVEQLAERVREISKVLDVIRSIAEQTNLLALNAAIEAARAGDAGRGFAVVADEVRALAHRTQQSTQEIEQMIGGIQSGTDRAVNAMQSSNGRARSTLEVAQAAGAALEQITQAISSINERNLVIASASEEQAQVAREVDRNLVNIRDLSMQTSAGANQTSAASQELSRLAIDLNNLVARFKV